MRVLKITAMAALLLMAASVAFAGPTYDRVMSTKVVKAGISNQGIPFGFINDKNEWTGFDVDMATEIAKRLGATAGKDRCEQQHPHFLRADQPAQGRHGPVQHDPQTRT